MGFWRRVSRTMSPTAVLTESHKVMFKADGNRLLGSRPLVSEKRCGILINFHFSSPNFKTKNSPPPPPPTPPPPPSSLTYCQQGPGNDTSGPAKSVSLRAER